MSAELAVAAPAQSLHPPFATQAIGEGRFFATMSAVMLAVVLVGFAPTFYLRPLHDLGPMPIHVHIHGAVLTGWFALLPVQAFLASAGSVQLHRRLGMFGLALGVVVLVTSPFATLIAISSLSATYGLDSALPFTAIGVAGSPIDTVIGYIATRSLAHFAYVSAFTAFLTGAVLFRRRPDVHKRLMILASLAMIGPAFTRMSTWPVFGGAEDFRFGIVGLTLLLFAMVVYDYLSARRVHRVTLWGGMLCVLSILGARIVGGTAFGEALVRAIA